MESYKKTQNATSTQLQSSSFHTPTAHSASVVLPLARGHSYVGVLLVPGEEVCEGQGAVGLHRAGQDVELRAAGPHQRVGAAQVNEQPLLEEVLRVVGKERALAHKLHPALDVKLGLSSGQATAVDFGCHSCEEKKRNEK